MTNSYPSSLPAFNINGDEPFDLGKGRGKAMADQVGSHQMYVDWIGKICRHVKELGKQPMFWGDIILAHSRETLSGAAKAGCHLA
ncbi:MAG: hypothetical protein ACLU9S_10900 [Oscillospiraceae bacterium]